MTVVNAMVITKDLTEVEEGIIMEMAVVIMTGIVIEVWQRRRRLCLDKSPTKPDQ